jgi:hypothetical protein
MSNTFFLFLKVFAFGFMVVYLAIKYIILVSLKKKFVKIDRRYARQSDMLKQIIQRVRRLEEE